MKSSHNAIQETIHRNGDMDRNTHVMIANLEYFFDKISIIFSKDYGDISDEYKE